MLLSLGCEDAVLLGGEAARGTRKPEWPNEGIGDCLCHRKGKVDSVAEGREGMHGYWKCTHRYLKIMYILSLLV